MWNDYSFIVKCNDGPSIRIGVVAESLDKAQMYAKSMYAAEHKTYADDRYNNWLIRRIDI